MKVFRFLKKFEPGVYKFQDVDGIVHTLRVYKDAVDFGRGQMNLDYCYWSSFEACRRFFDEAYLEISELNVSQVCHLLNKLKEDDEVHMEFENSKYDVNRTWDGVYEPSPDSSKWYNEIEFVWEKGEFKVKYIFHEEGSNYYDSMEVKFELPCKVMIGF